MLPILYSFRRCPYAIRARLAIAVSQQAVQLREIELKHKPAALLTVSPNKTIPVLQFGDPCHQPSVLTESLDIMIWALSKHDPQHWLAAPLKEMLLLIEKNDHEFKPWLDKYKYADRYPEHDKNYYREQAEVFLIRLEKRLAETPYFYGQHATLADMAIFPFIRQFANVDQHWFQHSAYKQLNRWLHHLINTSLFAACMQKYPTWLNSGKAISFP